MSHLIRPVLILAIGMTLSNCAGKGAYPASALIDSATFTSLERYQRVYVLAPGDQIEISVDRLPEFSRSVIIRPDGFVSLPKFGEISLGGLSVPEANARLGKILAQRVVGPEVTIIVANPRDDVVFVSGEIGHPSAVPLRQARTVAEALIVAGGPTRSAALDRVALVRLEPDGHLAAHIVERRSKGYAGAYLNMASVLLQSGDLIVVPESNRSQFTRLVQDLINTPLNGVNQLFTPYLQYRLIGKI